ncbi:MAG: hypothetical protein HYZ29_05930 [Myxococcales bacterium]|nr:hypothetical protein [Myxococcales bacterium]
MPEYSGSLPSFELALSLWLAPLLPLVAAIYAGLGGYIAGGDDSSLPKTFRPLNVALAAAVAALGIVAFHLVVLFGLPPTGRQLVSHAWGMQRIGSLDTSFTFSGDPTTLGLALVICVAAAAALAVMAPSDGERRVSAGVGLVLGGGLFVVLGDDLSLVVAGSVASGVGALVLAPKAAGARAARGFVVGRLGDAALIGAAALLVWGLAGSFTGDGDYVPDFRPRLVAVQIGDAPPPQKERGAAARDAMGTITMSALPGASLVLGGAELCATDPDGKRGGVGTSARPCRETARSPFSRLPVPVALHDIEVRTGPGTHDLVVEKTRVASGAETVIAMAGATSVLREMRDQLAIRDGSGAHSLRIALTRRKVLGQPFLGLVGGLFVVFAVLRSLGAAWSASQRASAEASAPSLAALGAGIELWVAAAVLLRVDFFFSFVPGTASACAAIASALALLAAAKSAHGFDLRRSLALVAIANGALSTAACLLGAHVAAAVGLMVTSLGLAGFVLAADGTDLRERAGSAQDQKRVLALSALALSGGPIPLVGAFWARDGLLAAAASLGTLLGWVTLALAAATSGGVAFAVWRLMFLLVSGKPKGGPASARPARFALVPAALGVLVGALAHVAAVTGAPPLLEAWLAPIAQVDFRGVPMEKSVRVAIAAVGFAAVVAGFVLARGRYGASRVKDWAERETERPMSEWLGSSKDWFDAAITRPVLGVARGVARFDAALEALSVGGLPEAEPAKPPREKRGKKPEPEGDE